MADLLKTNVYGGLTVTGNMAVYLDKRDFSTAQTVTLLDNNGLPVKTADGDIKDYTLLYDEPDGEELDVMIGDNWKLYDTAEGKEISLIQNKTTIIYSLSTFVFRGIYG